jgi:hypothetical protein
LWRADLSDTSLTGARLRETHLERANLTGAGGLTWEQGKDAFTDDNTILPDYLTGGRAGAPIVAERPLAPAPELEEAIPPPAGEREPEPEPEAEPKPGGKKLARPRRRNPALVAPPGSA